MQSPFSCAVFAVFVLTSLRTTGIVKADFEGALRQSPYALDDVLNCGPRCLAFLERYAGKSATYEKVVALCPPTRDGVTMLELSSAATALGWHVEPFRASFGQLYRLQRLAILHLNATKNVDSADNWTDNHFVVYLGYNKKSGKYLIYDPPRELREVDTKYLKKRFSGLGLTLCKMEQETKAPSLASPLAYGSSPLLARCWQWRFLGSV